MIGLGWLLLLGGFSISGTLAAWSDFRTGRIFDGCWLPALIAAGYFYWSLGSFPVAAAAIFPGLVTAVVASFVVWLSTRSYGKTGGADIVSLFVMAAWPAMLFDALLMAVVLYFLLNFRRRYMMKAKLAGTLGALIIPAGLLVLFA